MRREGPTVPHATTITAERIDSLPESIVAELARSLETGDVAQALTVIPNIDLELAIELKAKMDACDLDPILNILEQQPR